MNTIADVPPRAEVTELVAVLVAVSGGQPRVLTTAFPAQQGTAEYGLPSGPFQTSHRSLQAGMRAWVETHTHHPMGYVEQLYTFADSDRANWHGQRIISVSYLGLTREQDTPPAQGVAWHDWYDYFPWEDWRDGPPAMLQDSLAQGLAQWAAQAAAPGARQERLQRVDYLFPCDPALWNADLILQRYELLFEAGLTAESRRGASRRGTDPSPASLIGGHPMRHDHRRILATGIARLRAKIRYRPVVFELMPPAFTLLQLQQTFEALTGQRLHKQNFRRFIEQQALVEETGAMTRGQAGRPAKLFQFRAQVMRERAISGSKLPIAR